MTAVHLVVHSAEKLAELTAERKAAVKADLRVVCSAAHLVDSSADTMDCY